MGFLCCRFEGHAFYEASSLRRIDGRYYFIYFSEVSHELCWAWAQTPEGPVTYGGVLHSNGDIGMHAHKTVEEAAYYWGNNHGSIAVIDGRPYIFGHRQTNRSEGSRQGVAAPLTIREDGFIEQAEMTSCGLNGGPISASRETPAYVCRHLRSRGGAAQGKNEAPLGPEHPCVTQDNDAGSATSAYAYVQSRQDGGEVGYTSQIAEYYRNHR